jgi:hypothetical protein
MRHYEKLFGTVWFDFNRDTLFLDFGMGFPPENAFTEDNLSVADLSRIRLLASNGNFKNAARHLVRLTASMPNLMMLFVCSLIVPSRFPVLFSRADFSDLVSISRCPGWRCCANSPSKKHNHNTCRQTVVHIQTCNCDSPWTRLLKLNWYMTHGGLGITLLQPSPPINWVIIQGRATRDALVANAKKIGLHVLL